MRVTALCFPFCLSLLAPAWADEIPQTDVVTGATEAGDTVTVATADEYQDTAEKLPADYVPSENMKKYTLEERVAMTISYDLAMEIRDGTGQLKELGENINLQAVARGVNEYLDHPEDVDMEEADRVLAGYYESIRKKELFYNFNQYTGQVHHIKEQVARCFAEHGIDGYYDNCRNGMSGRGYMIPGATDFSTDLVKSTEVEVLRGDDNEENRQIFSVKLTVNEKSFGQPYNLIYDGFWNKTAGLFWRLSRKSTCFEAGLCR